MAKEYKADISDIVHPGNILGMELKERGISQKRFAEQIAIQQSHLSEIINGKRNFNEAVSKKIEAILGIPHQHWLQLQKTYDLKVEETILSNDEEAKANSILIMFDEIYDMKSIYRHIGLTKEKPTMRLKVCREELNFGTPTEQRRKVQGYFHRSEKTGLDARMIATWTVLAKYEASRLPLPLGVFSKEKMDELSMELREIFTENHNTLNRIKWKLSEYGIKFCVVGKLPHASIDGYSFLIDEIPCIVVTKRFDRIDNIAFAVLHEVGHLNLHLGSSTRWDVNYASIDEEGVISKEETEANDYAAEALIPKHIWEDAPSIRPNSFAIQSQYKKWAKSKGINVWIALGRLSHETGMYKFKSDNSRNIN